MTKRKSESYWLQLIEQCRNSGLSDRQWCLNNDISFSTFYYHVSTLHKKACEIPVANQGTMPIQQEVVQVNLIDNAPVEQLSEIYDNSAIRLNLNGVSIAIFNHASADVIQNTLCALQRLC